MTQNATNAPAPDDVAARMCEVALAALEDAKGTAIQLLDVRALTDITDYMIISTGSSQRHIKTLSERVLEKMREAGWTQLGVEGDDDWLLVDFVDVVVHIMRAPARELYNLEGLWDANLALPAAAEDA
ncbi:MAG: ribosome silencing factor [Gammaproteobacteria bacterium]|nr:ribosome silencing factor [Gammaproteobacteria bacterium]CAJ2376396.1 MAG: ribosomal silencing factor RsfS (modular protein) [Arenicellales bacterium IbO2]MDA7960980.1 ribosome silencing factor [Gammaproteobacteria bacterium]MDA7970263.1 ribosome silencing factor [Gammaproteobacteria bacterium]MDA7971910.1 ribosome silencing factor [Gammaproteobacteria bacterium]